jgi:hypothetical protein
LLFLSIRHHTIARYLFITLAFASLLSTGFFGIPLIPKFFLDQQTDLVSAVFTLLSALGTIWGVMAYREFTKSIDAVIEARIAARKLDPMIGDYEYRSYNPITRKYEDGFVPSGPVDFWDKETLVPEWMDKGKYWHVLLSLHVGSREVKLKVVPDRDLPFSSGTGNVAVTARERVVEEEMTDQRYRYVVKIPQWLIMNTERTRFASRVDIATTELSALISELNKKIVDASYEVAGWERLRIRYPWKAMTLGIYLNKSLPLGIVYRQVLRRLPGRKRRVIDETNLELANIKDDKLISSLLELASEREIPQNRLEMLRALVSFLKNAYTRLGLGEGANEYHSFHHSLEVSYMVLYMLPREFDGFTFGPKEYEIALVAALIHDYDPAQIAQSSAKLLPKGPNVKRTADEIQRTRILDAYFTMSRDEFENYFREIKSSVDPPLDFATTHPEYVKPESSPVESKIVEALVWRTDFPFDRQQSAKEMFRQLLTQLANRGENADKFSLLAEILWLADLAVTYMGSDPVRAWDRVTSLYDELSLPKLEAVPRTDEFFADFADNETFRRIIARKNFPWIFRRRWNTIYNFFHEGNPSTQLNKTIGKARKMYRRVNLEIGMKRGELLQSMAAENWSEYFIGIGRDQNEVFRTKTRFARLDPQNASAFWGDAGKLLPAITDRKIDSFFLVLPEHEAALTTVEGKAAFLATLSAVSEKLARGGALRILTDVEKESKTFRELLDIASQAGFQLAPNSGKSYFPSNWRDPEFKDNRKPQVLVLALN